jgi:hypothetical protein
MKQAPVPSQAKSKHLIFRMWGPLVLVASLLSVGTSPRAQHQPLGVQRVISCKSSQLAVSIPPPGPKTAGVVMQGAVFALWVTNRGTVCSVRGYPRLTAIISASGKKLTFSQVSAVKTGAGGPYADATVVLKDGSSAASLVAYAGGPLPSSCAKWLVVRPLVGTRATRLRLRHGLRICPGSYRTHELQVTPYHPASVGPFSHWP